LSVDDGTNSESMSIGNQKSMLTDYVRKQGWRIEQVYVDDGSEKEALTDSVRALEDTVRTLESAARDVSQFVALLKEHVGLQKLDRPTLLKLIDRITIEEPPGSYGRKRQQTLHIHYKLVGEL